MGGVLSCPHRTLVVAQLRACVGWVEHDLQELVLVEHVKALEKSTASM
jgi:hypothetical protein